MLQRIKRLQKMNRVNKYESISRSIICRELIVELNQNSLSAIYFDFYFHKTLHFKISFQYSHLQTSLSVLIAVR